MSVRSITDRTWAVVGVGGSPRAASSGGSLGKRIELALANSLMDYLSSTLWAQCSRRNRDTWTDPIAPIP